MSFVNQTDRSAHQAIRNLSTSLAQKGILPPEARKQMCDGFVSSANQLQAQQAMIDAQKNGDGTAYQQAEFLHQALGIAMRFQDPKSTRAEGRSDADETLQAREQRRMYGDYGSQSNERPSAGAAIVAGALLVGALALMKHRQDERREHRNDDRRR